MNSKCITTGTIGLAIALALTGPTEARPVDDAGRSSTGVTFFLADPELGVAGVYRRGESELYFEARRSIDAASGALGPLSLRVIDGDARTLAVAGKPLNEHWVPPRNEFAAARGFNPAPLLNELGQALAAARMHETLSNDQAALVALTMQAAHTPAAALPLQLPVNPRRDAAPNEMQIAAFYLDTLQDLHMQRRSDHVLQVDLGNGVTYQSSQRFLAGEYAQDGTLGRIDAYSLLTDADGHVLAAELGGDSTPRAWSEAMERHTERDDFALAVDNGRAASVLNGLGYGAKGSFGVALSMSSEQEAMQRLARSLSNRLLPIRDAADTAEAQVTPSAVTHPYRTDISVWSKPFASFGEHSATFVRKWRYNSSGRRTVTGSMSFCNHGTCAFGDNMTEECFYGGVRARRYHTPIARWDDTWHTCATRYHVLSPNNRHNCNDDSWTQVQAVRARPYDVNGGRCSDIHDASWAPSCR